MSALTVEQFEQLPEFAKSEYVETDKGYQHGGFVKLKGSLDDLDIKYKTIESQLNSANEAKQAEIEEAKKQAYEEAKKSGNVEEVERRYQEMMADSEKRAGETLAQYKERIEKLTGNMKAEKVNAVVADLAAKHATEAGRETAKLLLKQLVDFDPETNKTIFKGLDGSATSLDLAGFESDLLNNPVFAPLLKANVNVDGGGNVNGNTSGSATSKQISRKDFDNMNQAQRQKFFSSGGKIVD